ncbi:MAG TPA: hypothetical protein VFT78_06820 [Hanamia sp.]|nr:hypothetical protein [Hanamia sp.]
MFLDHPLFKPPEDKIQKIWRYMDFTKYVELLNSSTLYFTRADNFEDKFEGSLTRSDINSRTQWWESLPEEDKHRNPHLLDSIQKFQQEEKKAMAINCWHMNKFESAAMCGYI